MKGYIEINRELCKGCQICMAFCSKAVIAPYSKVNVAGYLPVSPTNNEECTGCGVCAIVCPEVAIEVYRD